MQWILESLALAIEDVSSWLTGLYGEKLDIDGVEYTVEGIDEFHVVSVHIPPGGTFVVVAKVHLEPNFRSNAFSAKNIVELESDLDDRLN